MTDLLRFFLPESIIREVSKTFRFQEFYSYNQSSLSTFILHVSIRGAEMSQSVKCLCYGVDMAENVYLHIDACRFM
jgi:hypothetical protein